MSRLSEIRKLDRTYQISEFSGIIKSDAKLDARVVQDIETRMKREELIATDQDVVTLTQKGEKRFRRTSKSDREKWKREISNIACSWLNKPSNSVS